MSWFTKALSGSVGKKLVMSLTGLFLILFLIEHLIGNFMLLKGDGGVAFNEFAHFMKHNPVILVGEIVMFIGILLHVIDGLALERKNRSARPIGYATPNKSAVTSWTSKYMGPFGIIILIFLAIHLYDFFRYKYFSPVDNMPGTDISDLASLVYIKFQSLVYVVFYVIAMIVIGFHLNHGFQSAFQTLGLNHAKYTPAIKFIGSLYAILVPLGYALIPVIIYIQNISN
ncbi:MAG: succinate dehydrogenase cytochrome b subunit [Cyclobacteriaceae bacterium]|nr:succinate dehydrogenase cytochrome b subunit [Cyclobacteriaceae bacterium]